MTNTSRLAVVLGLLFSIISISTSGAAQPPPPPYTHYKIINAEVQGQLVVGAPVTIVAVIQDMGNVESSSGTYEIYINRTSVDYRTIYLSSGDSTTVRYTHYFDSPGTYSIDIVTCSELGSCPDDLASGTISIDDSSPPQEYIRFTGTLTNVSEAESDIGYWLLYTVRPDSSYGLGSEVMLRAGPVSCASGPSQIDVYINDIGSQVEVYSTTNGDVSCAPAYIRKISEPTPDDRNRPPSVTLSCYPLNLTPDDTLSCEANASDPDGDPLTYEWFLNGQKLTNLSPSDNKVYGNNLQPGSYTLKVVVSDNRGGANQSSVSFTVRGIQQNKPPVIQSIEYDPARPVAGQLVSFWANAYDENGWIVTYEWDFGSRPFSIGEQAEYTWPNPGTYTVCLTVYDNDRASTRKCRDITVQQAKTLLPPQANFTFSPSNPKAGEIVYFKDQSTDPDGRIEIRGWFLNEQFFSGDPNPTTTFSAPGTYTVCLQVVDNDFLNNEKCTTITVLPADKPKQKPNPDFSISNTSPKVGETLYFRDRSTDDNRIVQWSWNFGNGRYSNEQNPTQSYSTAGTYNVCLTVTDNDGLSAERCYSLTVRPEEKPVRNPTLRVEGSTSSTKQQGQKFNLSGSGYTPNGNVTVFVEKDGKLIDIFTKRADNHGNIQWIWPEKPDCSTPVGIYELQALDDETGQWSNNGSSIREEVVTNPACSATKPSTDKLISPVQEYPDLYSIPISAVYDHSGSPGTKDGIVRAFNGEEGSVGSSDCKSSKSGGKFLTGVVNYVSYSGGYLCYDGHYGIDFAVYNSTVVAVAPGKVIKTHTGCPNERKDDCGLGWGNYIVIKHPTGLQTLYAHLKSVSLSEGTEVLQGQEIGISGNSGMSEGPHLHFGVCRQDAGICNTRNAAWVDPYAENLWASSKPVSPRDKSLVRVQDHPDVFWLQNGKRYHVLGKDKASIDIIKAMSELPGWGWDKVQIVSTEVLSQFKYAGEFIALDQSSNGILIREKGTKPVYIIENGRPLHVRNEKEFIARGLNWNDVIEVSADIRQHLFCSHPRQIDRNSKLERFAQAIQIHEGWQPGTASCKNNNPGNLRPIGGKVLQTGGIGVSSSGFTIFETYDQGWQALLDDIQAKVRNHPSWNFYDFFNKYAPLEDNNNPRAYAEAVAKRLGVSPSTAVSEYLNEAGGIDRGDGSLVPPPTTKTIEQAIASLVPNDPSDVTDPDLIIGDIEMTKALGFYEKQQPVPNTDGQIIDDATMLRLQDLWISRRPVSSSASLRTSEIRREWRLLTRQLDRRTMEFIALGFGVRSIKVEIFNLQGQRVFVEEAPSNRLTFRGQDSQGQRLANGVYLYAVTVRNHDGTIKRSDVRKLVLQR